MKLSIPSKSSSTFLPEAAGLRTDIDTQSSSSKRWHAAYSEYVSDSEGEQRGGAADQAPGRPEPGVDEWDGGAMGGSCAVEGAVRKTGERQEATAIVLDKALKLYGKRISCGMSRRKR